MIFNTFIPPISKYFDVFWLYRLSMRKLIESRGDNNRHNQREANQWFEGEQFNFAQSYANHLVTIMISLFFIPILPLSPILGAVSIITAHYMEKYLLLRRNSAPKAIGSKLCFTIFRFYDIVIIVFAVSVRYLTRF